jgi:cyclic pyranopterin phosphate synthase
LPARRPFDSLSGVKKKLTHLDRRGQARMVDVGAKPVTARAATAEARVRMRPDTLKLIHSGGLPKGDVLAAARLAGTMASKRTPDLIPLCHPVAISSASVEILPEPPDALRIVATVRASDRTGVEMEALTAAAVAALTVYDMAKAVDRGMTVESIRLLEKSGGRSGRYVATGRTTGAAASSASS